MVLVLAYAIGALAQGQVRLYGRVGYQVPGSSGWPAPGTLLFLLLTAPPGTSDLSQFTPTGILATNSSTVGWVFGRTVSVPGWQPGEVRAFAIVGWHASHGTNFNPAWLQEGCIVHGVSAIGSGPAGGIDPVTGGPIPPLNPFGFISSGLTIGGPLSPDRCSWIETPPASQSAVYGSTVTFSVTTYSSQWPMTYQWQFNGTDLPGATNSVLVLSNVQPSQAGAYSVTVWNGWSPVSSSLAYLDLYSSPIVSPPGQTAEVGSTAKFHADAVATPPATCQWFFNATSALTAPGEISDLVLTNLILNQEGAYTVVISNAYGVVTSAPAMLGVVAPVERRPVVAVNLSGTLGQSFNLEVTHTLEQGADWTPLDTVTLTNPGQFYIDAASLSAQRFYRAWQAPPVDTAPALAAHIIPAITLTGAIGTSLRVDYINQFGPTDAWVTLATVTLTNTPQLYFDTSAIGQPPRLYRVVPVP